MTNLKSRRGKKAKNTNNERWYECQDCDFTFITYKRVERKIPFCPNCGECISVIETEAKGVSTRESYRVWTEEELEVVRKVAKGEMMPYQCAMLLGRSKSSVSCKARRLKKRGE